MNPTAADLLSASLGRRYRLERELGRGGMAAVYLVRDLKHDRLVALKVVRPDLAAVLGSERFLREIAIASKLTHPHILPLYDSGTAIVEHPETKAVTSVLYYVMPYIEGESLRGRLAREHRLPVGDAVAIGRQVADALAYAHSHNVVHRDIKPENILLQAGQALVADFGIARAIVAAGGDTISEPGFAVGTPAYMSPEQAAGSHEVDGRSDIYSLGCVIYEMLAGEPPHTGATPQVVIARHRSEAPRSLKVVRPTVADPVEGAVMKALAKVPADRFATATEFAAALSGVASGPFLATPTAVEAGARPKAGRRPLLALGMILVGLAWLWWRPAIRAPAPTDPVAEPSRVAVLYFDDRSQGGRLRHVANGLTEDLIDELSRVPALHVISPNGVRPYSGRHLPPDSLARLLGVGSIVDGSVGPGPGGLHVAVRLIDAGTGVQLQSGSIRGEASDVFAIEDKLAGEVVRFLRERLGREIELRKRRSGTRSTEAWERTQSALQLREDARTLMAEGDPRAAARSLAQSDSLLALASRRDPRWPTPLVLRGWNAQARLDLVAPVQGDSVRKLIHEGLETAERALALRPDYPPALELRGTLRYELWKATGSVGTDIDEAERDLRAAAVPENPNQARAWSTLSTLLQARGSLAEASLAAQKAYEVDAFLAESPAILFRLYHTSIDLGRGEEAIKWCNSGRSRFPDDWKFAFCELTILLWPGLVQPDVERAWRLVSDLERLTTPEDRVAYLPRWQMMVAGVLERARLPDSAEAVIARARAASSGDPDLDFHEAAARMLRGDRHKAVMLLQRFVAARPQFRSYIRVDPVFRQLREDEQFRALVGEPAPPGPP